MAVTLQAGGAVQIGSTSLTVTGQPSGLLADDILVLVAFHKDIAAPAVPAGWTSLFEENSPAGYVRAFWKRVGAGVTSQADVTITGLVSCSAGSMTVWRGALASGSPFQPASDAGAGIRTNNTAEALSPSLTTPTTLTVPSTTEDAVLVVWAVENDDTFATWAIQNVAATEIGENLTTTGTDCSLGQAWRRPASTNEVIDTVFVVLKEASAGTSISLMMMFALLGAAAPAAAASFIRRRGPSYRR